MPRVTDRWAAMVATLRAEPLPALPDLPGRRIACADALATADEITQAMADGCTALELAAMAGITRQAAFERLRQLHHQQEIETP